MSKFVFNIKETISQEIKVDANTISEATEIVKNKIINDEISLDKNSFSEECKLQFIGIKCDSAKNY